MPLKAKKISKPNGRFSRKQLRKEKRQEKKIKRNEYYTKRGKSITAELKSIANTLEKPGKTAVKRQPEKKKPKNVQGNKVISTEDLHQKEKREQKKLQKNMAKQRIEQLRKENAKEDRLIKKLEKQLKLHKRKTKTIPKCFVADGLDYLLEVCDPEYMKDAVAAEQDLIDANDNFEEDFALMTGQGSSQNKKEKNKSFSEGDGSDFEGLLSDEDESEEESDNEDGDITESDCESEMDLDEISVASVKQHKKGKPLRENDKNKEKNQHKKLKEQTTDIFESEENSDFEIEETVKRKTGTKRKLENIDNASSKHKKQKKNTQVEEMGSGSEFGENGSDSDDNSNIENTSNEDKNAWEDIYGRLRSKDGAVITSKEDKYVPPAIRAKMESTGSEDKKQKEKLEKLKKQIKGLLNRLAESNMHNIANQFESFYMNNSRNAMNETLTSLVMESLVSTVLTPERLLMEHILLIAILHANVGTEVGAHFLQTIIKKFDILSKANESIENKSLDNTVNILAQLYNFKVFDAKLLYEILHRLASSFEEKNVECILHILRSVGFGLRKDDPLALKNLILELQKRAASASEGKLNNSRVQFLLNVLLAIKNNNVTKIPNYDTTYSEHLKKIMKGFIRKGNYVSPLNISLEDLLKADERGKWWVVGSAWTGASDTVAKKEKTTKTDTFSQKLLDLARKQRMNTDTRRDIFCIIMSAEDFLDAFEKLLKLGLKNQQEREIIQVILHCCLQEKSFNPYYAILAQKFCDYDRKFQMTIKCSVWDKLKTLKSHSGQQLSNLAKLLIHLFIEKGLPISTLKIIEFSELDKVTLRLMRQILLGILLHNDIEAVQSVFEKIGYSDKLKMFRESLRLFIHHFLLRNLKTESVPEDQKQILEERARMVERILTAKDSRLRL